MVISRKPKPNNIDNKLVDQILSKGGSTTKATSTTEGDNENLKITIRLPKKMLEIIDNYLSGSIYTKPRNIWIKEAIEKKVQTEILEKAHSGLDN
jgi:hypothetical protein